MFSYARHLLGAIRVVEQGDLIDVEGLPARVTMRDITSIWSTSRIANYMFTKVKQHSISFNRFFAPDIAYTLDTVVKQRLGRHYTRALGKVVQKLYEDTWLKTTQEEQPDILNYDQLRNLNVTLLEHQTEFLHTYNRNVPRYQLKGYLLGAAPGSGKTITGLALGEVLEADLIVCIVPKNSVNKVWEDTIASLYKTPARYWVSTNPQAPQPGCRHYVFHYEQLDRAVEFFKTYGGNYKKPLVLLDESHNLNELDSQRTQLFIKLCAELNAQHVVWASGTPVKAIGNEVIPLLMTLDKYFDRDAQERFKQIFGKNAARAVDILRNRLGMMTFKVDKKIVVGNQVETRDVKIKIPDGEKYTLDHIREEMKKFIEERMKYYESHMKEFMTIYTDCLALHERTLRGDPAFLAYDQYRNYISQIRKGYDPVMMKEMVIYCNQYELKTIVPSLPQSMRDDFKDVRSVVKYYPLKVQGEALGRILGKQRSQCHVDMVPHIDWEDIIDTSLKKTLIFTSYVEVVDAIDKHLREGGYEPLKVYGETNKDLPAIVTRFGKEPDANPLAATYKSLSTAVPLVMANTVVLVNSPFREYEREQAVSRVDRLGQDAPVVIINVLLDTDGKPNISTRSNDILNWSKEQVDAIMGTSTAGMDLSMEAFQEMVPGLIAADLPQTKKPVWSSW